MTQDPRDRFTRTPVAYQLAGTDRVAVQPDIQFWDEMPGLNEALDRFVARALATAPTGPTGHCGS